MKNLYLYNTAHPLAESGKPIFIPFGERPYDATCRQENAGTVPENANGKFNPPL